MSAFDESEKPKRSTLIVLLFSVLVIAFIISAIFAWSRYNPLVNDKPDVQAAIQLLEVARKRSLTDEEFGSALKILVEGSDIAQIATIATLEADVARNPAKRERAIVALEQCQENASPKVGQSAGIALGRLKGAEASDGK